VLLARGLIDPYQFDSLARVTFWLSRLARNFGPKPFAVGSLWQVLINGMIGTATTGQNIFVFGGPPRQYPPARMVGVTRA
jgi:hypothetical protein